MWLGITNIWTYVIGTMIIVLLPGPNSMFVLSTAAGRGVRRGYQAAFGVFLGDGIIMFLSAAGVAALLQAEPWLFDVVKYAGAAYLCYIGYGLLRGAWRRPKPTGESAETPALEERHPFRRALAVSLLNPKAILFFVSFFIQFVSPDYDHRTLSFLILGTIAEIFSCAYLTTLIFAGSYLAAQFRARRRLARGLTTGVAAVFIGFAVRLATASLG
jgi:leucine efflux protein